MSNHSRRNEKSILLSDQENDSIFNVLGRGCLNQQKTWEQELYIHFKYKTPREFFHTFEAHDCQAGLNFASEEEANIFKRVVLGKLSDRQKKRQEKRKQQDGSARMPPRSTGEKRTVNLSSVSAGDTTPNKPVVNTVKEKSKSKDKGKGGGKKKITKADISTPTQFRHVGHVGWDPESGLQTEKLDPELGALFEEIGINTQMDDDTMDFIYDFVDKHGGLDAVREDLARRKPPAVTPPTTGQDKPSHLPARPAFAAPDPPGRGQAPPPPSRPSRPSAAPPPTPSRQGQQHSGGTGRNVPPPPPLNIPAAPPPPPPSSAAPPPTSSAPPPPPFKKSTETSTPPQSSGRTGLLDAIVNFKSASLSHVKADENVGKSVSSSVEAPGGIAAALMDALNKRKPAMQFSVSSVSAGDTTPNKPVVNTVKEKSKSKDKGKGGGKKKITKADISTPTQFRHVGHVGWDPESGLQTEKLDPELGALFEEIGINTQMDDDTMDFIYDFVDKHGGLDAVREDLARRKPPAVTPPTTGQDKPSHLPARPAFAAPDPPGRGQAPPPPSRPSRPSAAPPPTPSRQGQQHSGGTGRNVPPPPPLNIPAAPPPPPPSSAAPPPTSSAPPPPPFKKSTETSTPPQSSGRTGLLDAIVNFKSASLSHVKADENVGKSVSSSVEAPGGIAAALMDALNKRKPAMQFSDDDDDRSSDEMDDDDDDEWDD